MEEKNRPIEDVNEIEDEVYSIELMTEIWDNDSLRALREKCFNPDDIHERNKQEFRDFIKRKARR